MATTYTRDCRRCNGTGIWNMNGPKAGTCFNCAGSGIRIVSILSTEEKAQQADYAAREQFARDAVRTAAGLDATEQRRAYLGYLLMRDEDRDGFEAMITSITAERAADVARSLIEYRRQFFRATFANR